MGDIEAAALAEHHKWQRELSAELVTHSHETLAQVLMRLERERPETPHQRLLRQRREQAHG